MDNCEFSVEQEGSSTRMHDSSSRSTPVGNETRIGLSLSGGGFRAAAFHLGVLKRLEELGVLPRVEVLSVVSGGAITGALYALRCAQRGGSIGCVPVDDLIAELKPFLMRNLRGHALFGTPVRTIRTLLSFLVPRVQRAPLITKAFEALFRGATMRDVPPWLVINATNLRTGKAWKFSRDLMGDYVVGACSSGRDVTLSTAVTASAAFPGLVDALPLRTSWGALDPERIGHPVWPTLTPEQQAEASRWRERFGEARIVEQGRFGRMIPNPKSVVMPLVDGGVYDNDGIVSLRAARVSHVIVSSSAPPSEDFHRGFPYLRELVRVANIMHSRLGGTTRALCWESTHRVGPEQARQELLEIASSLERIAASASPDDTAGESVGDLTARLRMLAEVGVPEHGWQYRAAAQIVLHRLDLATDRFAKAPVGAFSVPPEERGLAAPLLEELARVRTDLDGHKSEVIDLLIGQGYLMTYAYLRGTMPEVLPIAATRGEASPDGAIAGLATDWSRPYRSAIQRANTNEQVWRVRLRREGRRKLLFGRCGKLRHYVQIWSSFVGGVLVSASFVYGAAKAIVWMGRHS